MVDIDIHWPNINSLVSANVEFGISYRFLIYRVIERLKSFHEEIEISNIDLGVSNTEHNIRHLFCSVCVEQDVKVQESCNAHSEKIFYYISEFHPKLSEDKMREDASSYIIANAKIISDKYSAKNNLICDRAFDPSNSSVIPFSPLDYSERYILNPYTLGRYDTFYSINHSSLNTTAPLRRYSSFLTPNYASFSPLGGLYVYYDCCTESISTLGHRFSDTYMDHICKNRDEYFVVAVFGGSAAYSIFCTDNEYFGSKMAEYLNERDNNKQNKKIVVINFSLPGTTIFEARLYFTIEAAKLIPDLCILHFGWNESRLGPITHPSLAKHGIFFNHLSNSYLSTYDRIQKVHSTEDYSVLPTFPSIPHKAFASFLYESILSFNDMIKRFDSKLILGLQPIINTNRSYSNRLHQYLCSQESFYNTEYQDSLYMVLPDMIMQNSELSFVNIDDKIYQLEEQNSGNDDFIFIDSCHLNSRGDAFVAEIYSEFISSSILS